jgi:ABC-type branched-subunit amino acid transport system ATPase component
VKNVSFTVHPREVLGVIGPNGAGKTTLIDAVSGFVRAKGSVRIGATDASRMSPQRRAASGLARSFQAVEMFDDLTVEENIAVAADSRKRSRFLTDLVMPRGLRLTEAAEAAVQELGLTAHLGQRPRELSFAARRLVDIARCLSRAPSVVLLDEPAAGLDSVEVNEMTTLVRQMADQWGMGVVLVEHHLDMIMSACDRVVVLAQGEVIAEGTPEQIQADRAVRAAYIGDDDSRTLPATAKASQKLVYAVASKERQLNGCVPRNYPRACAIWRW